MTAHLERKQRAVCGVCGRGFAWRDGIPVSSIRPQIANYLDSKAPNWRSADIVCKEDLAAARREYVEDLVRQERGELTALDREVVDALVNHQTISDSTTETVSPTPTFGEELADRVANFGGSWTFIVSFACVLIVWMGFNAAAIFATERFDPYPFILLNLVLSCLAAIQAPLIMMSQKRQEAKDRQRAMKDYQVNLKAELEIRLLHEKVDHLMIRHWEKQAELQQVLMDQIDQLGAGRAPQNKR